MTPLDLDELERLEAAATPGPWEFADWNFGVNHDPGFGLLADGKTLGVSISTRKTVDFFTSADRSEAAAADAALIAALRNAFPALLAELRARRRQVERLTEAHRDICQGFPGPERRIAEAALDESAALIAAPAKGGEEET